MKKILSYSIFVAGTIFLAGVMVLFVIAFHTPAKVQASTYKLPNPVIILGNASYRIDFSSPSGSAGPFNQDFKIRMCLSAPDNNGWGPICFTSPWASQVNSGGSWATTEQIQGGITPFSNTGNWSVWAYPGHGDELENQGQGAPATIQVIPGNPLPPGEVITDLNLGLQLSEDNNGNIAGTMTDPDYCHTGGPARTGDGGDAGYVPSYAFSMSPGHCNYGFSPDVARMYMNDSIENAQASSNNIPTTFNVSQAKAIGTDMNPLEISVKNTGSTDWQIGYGGGQFSIIGAETGACDDPVSACPDPTSEPVGAQCISSGRWIGSSNPTGLQHISGSFSVGTDPAEYEHDGTNTCGVILGCSNPNTGNASCQQNQYSCEGFQSGEGCVDTAAPDSQACTNKSETWDGSVCINSGYTPYNNPPGSVYYNEMVTDCAQAGDTWVDPVCDGTWGPMDNVTTTGYDTPPGGTAHFLLSSLTAPSTPGTYTEDWQMENNNIPQWVPYYDATLDKTYYAINATGLDNFGDIIPITITINSSASSTITVSVTASPTTINTSGTSQCSAVVNGSSDQNVTWSVTGPGTIDSTSGVLTATGPGTATCIASPEADPTSSGSATITVNPAGPAGTIVVNSVNSVLGTPVTSTWNWPANVGPTDVTCETDHTDYNQAANLIYTVNPNYACGNGSAQQYSFNSVENTPIASASPKTLKEQILAFAKNMLTPNANAAVSVSPASSLTLLPSSTLNFTILWNPSAALSISPSSVSSTATAGGAPVNTTVNITNTGAPGSTLTWTATVNASSSSWLSVSPAADATGLTNGSSGNAAENITVSADPGTLSVGTYPGTITLDGFTKNPDGTLTRIPQQTLAVTFTVNPAGGSSAGFSCVSNACVAVPSGATYPNPGGATSCAAACIPPSCGGSPCGAPVCTLSATPSSVIIPQQATLSYNCTNIPPASSCKITGGNIASPITLFGNASNVVNGTTKVSPTSNSVYTIACSAPGGNTSASVPVNIGNSNLCESNPGGVNCPGK